MHAQCFIGAFTQLQACFAHALLDQRLAPGLGLVAGQSDAQGAVEVQATRQHLDPGAVGLGLIGQFQLPIGAQLTQQGSWRRQQYAQRGFGIQLLDMQVSTAITTGDAV